jgi:putative Mg2+ transporter-C (MgtC) family protein
MHVTVTELVLRIVLGWSLTFVLGFERELRDAPAGDRTFSLIGVGATLIGALGAYTSPSILAGAVTGIGFLGGGLCFRQASGNREILHGVTTAATIFAAAGIGAAVGAGLEWPAITTTALVLLTLEIRHLPLVRLLDARRWSDRFHSDDHLHGHLLHRTGHRPGRGAMEQLGEQGAAIAAVEAASDAVPAQRAS